MNIIVRFLIIISLFMSCEEKNESNDIVISGGTSFGECIGYCTRQIEISSTGLTYTATSWDIIEYPVLEHEDELTSNE